MSLERPYSRSSREQLLAVIGLCSVIGAASADAKNTDFSEKMSQSSQQVQLDDLVFTTEKSTKGTVSLPVLTPEKRARFNERIQQWIRCDLLARHELFKKKESQASLERALLDIVESLGVQIDEITGGPKVEGNAVTFTLGIRYRSIGGSIIETGTYHRNILLSELDEIAADAGEVCLQIDFPELPSDISNEKK